jgi:hypothetical protein
LPHHENADRPIACPTNLTPELIDQARMIVMRRYSLIFGRRENAEFAKLEEDVRALEQNFRSAVAKP